MAGGRDRGMPGQSQTGQHGRVGKGQAQKAFQQDCIGNKIKATKSWPEQGDIYQGPLRRRRCNRLTGIIWPAAKPTP